MPGTSFELHGLVLENLAAWKGERWDSGRSRNTTNWEKACLRCPVSGRYHSSEDGRHLRAALYRAEHLGTSSFHLVYSTAQTDVVG